MSKSEKLRRVEQYLTKYFDKWLIEDIKKILNQKLDFTFPYILLVSAGIDFLGGLIEGFQDNPGNSKFRSCIFIRDWMGKVNPLYAEIPMAELIYQSARCGASHRAMYKKGVESSSSLYPRNWHLYVNSSDQDRIFIHALQFTEDFIKAQELFRNEFIKNNSELVHDNLNKMLQTDLPENFEDLIVSLKFKHYEFNSDALTSRPPRDWSFEITPSQAPDNLD